jgi:hypothetical protein
MSHDAAADLLTSGKWRASGEVVVVEVHVVVDGQLVFGRQLGRRPLVR